VVIALVAEYRGTAPQIDAFGTPTVVHFSAVLLLSVVLTAPWPTLIAARIALATFGTGGAAYTIIVLRRARRQTDYQPVFEDWLFHAALPFTGYVSILVAAAKLGRDSTPLLFVVGGAGVLLMFTGIHNAWDTVTYIVVTRWESREHKRDG